MIRAACLILAPLSCFTQPTFNVRFDMQMVETGDGGFGIENTEYGFLVIGHGKRSAFPHRSQLVARGISHDGDMLFEKVYGPESARYFAGWCNSTDLDSDGNIILGGSGTIPDSALYEPYLIKFTPECDTMWKSSFYSEMQYIGYAGCQAADGGYALAGMTTDHDLSPLYAAYLYKTDSAGQIEWLKKYNHSQYSAYLTSIVALSDGGFVASGGGQWTAGVNSGKSDFFLLRTDINGNEVWRKIWGNPDNDFSLVVELADDGNVLVAGQWDDSESNSPSMRHHYFAKINAANNSIIWETILNPSVAMPWVLKVAQTSDGGIISAGSRRTNTPLNGEPWYTERGSLTKLSSEGDSLWVRTFAFEDHYPCHFRDVIETPDGGFAAVGVAEISPGYESDDTWVVKVDQHGCLVPGCHLVSVEELEASGGRMLVYPNPAKDVLNVYLETLASTTSPPASASGGRGGTPVLKLMDMQGRTVKQWRVGGEPTTYMADVSGLEAGVYVLRYEGGGVVLTEKVVVE